MSYELRNRPRSPWSLCDSVVEHRSAESEGLRLDSSRGIRIFSFVPRLWQDEKHLSLFLYRAQNLPSLLFLSTNITLSTLLILAVCRKRGQRLMQSHVKHGLLRNCFLPCHSTLREKLRDISKNEWAWSAESEGLRLDSSWALRIFSFSRAHLSLTSVYYSII